MTTPESAVTAVQSSEELARITRGIIEMHTEWDSLYTVAVIHRDAEHGVHVRTIAAIDPAFDPGMYPLLIEGLVRESLTENGPPYALLLQIEAYGASIRADASDEEKEQFEADGRSRSLHLRPDAVECAWAYTVDVHGRTWAASNKRGEDEIEEHFFAPGSQVIGGRFQHMLRAVIGAYGSDA